MMQNFRQVFNFRKLTEDKIILLNLFLSKNNKPIQ